jgi:hypothetical protein
MVFNNVTAISNIARNKNYRFREEACFMKMTIADDRGTTVGRSTYIQN